MTRFFPVPGRTGISPPNSPHASDRTAPPGRPINEDVVMIPTRARKRPIATVSRDSR